MDLTYLPDIFSLMIFIFGFRPLVRKVGSHVNLWFLGWTFMLVHYAALFLLQARGPCACRGRVYSVLDVWTWRR